MPDLSLPDDTGRLVRLGDFRGRRNLVLFLTHPAGCVACEEKLRELSGDLNRLRGEDAEVLAIVPGDGAAAAGWRRLALPFPMLTGGRAVFGDAAMIVADRFGEIFAIARADADHQLPMTAQLAEELAFVELQCPE